MLPRRHQTGDYAVNYDPATRTFDCEPTLTDSQVVDFCVNGYLILPGVIPPEINERARDYLDGKLEANPMYTPDGMTETEYDRIRASHEPSVIFLEEWFHEQVLLNQQLTGIMRSLLGRNVGLPVLASHHRSQCPGEPQGWHHDADRVFGPELEFVEVFYFPQDTPEELGPTEIVPGSHIRQTQRDPEEGGLFAEGPAGTLGIHHQSILHRRGRSTATGIRHMLKYNYWRTTPPQRDWISEEDFDTRTAYFGGHAQAIYTAHMYYWLCGKGDQYRIVGGQGWPWSTPQQIGPSWGYCDGEGGGRGRYIPDWRSNSDTYARAED